VATPLAFPRRLPKVIEAVANGIPIYVVEGEKDVHDTYGHLLHGNESEARDLLDTYLDRKGG
jgi:hypothetical protein